MPPTAAGVALPARSLASRPRTRRAEGPWPRRRVPHWRRSAVGLPRAVNAEHSSAPDLKAAANSASPLGFFQIGTGLWLIYPGPPNQLQESAFSASGLLRRVGTTSGGRAAGNATKMKVMKEITPITCAQAALAIVVNPIPTIRQAMASLGSRPGARAANRERPCIGSPAA